MTDISVQEVALDCFFSKHITVIKDLSYTAKQNSHSTFTLQVLLSENIDTSRLMNEKISISNKKTGEILFKGLIQQLAKETYNEVTVVDVTCKSSSVLLDSEKKSRTFQNKKDNYSKILNASYEEYNGNVIVQKDTEISPPILLYKETIWEHTLSMAALLSSVVVVDDKVDFPSVSIGFPRGKECKFSRDKIEIGSVFTYSHVDTENNGKEREHDRFINTQSNSLYKLGDYFSYEGTTYRITNIELIVEGNILNFHYTLHTEDILRKKRNMHNAYQGLILTGTVLDVQKEMLKIHFDIDETHDKEKAMWFPYTPDTNNAFYSMPEIGTKVGAKFQNKTFRIITCFHDKSAAFPDNEEKYFRTGHNQRLAMLPSELFFMNEANTMKISDSKGVDLDTSKEVDIYATGNIKLSAKHLTTSSPEQTLFRISSSEDGIDMSKSEVNIYGTELIIGTDGTGDKSYPKRDVTKTTEIGSEFASIVGSTMVSRISSHDEQ